MGRDVLKRISILGSTGSIGTQTLEVIRQNPSKFQVEALSAGRNIELLSKQILEFKPVVVGILSNDDYETVKSFIKKHHLKTDIVVGDKGLIQISKESHHTFLVIAVTGTASLLPTYETMKRGIPVGIACKEVLVAAGQIIMELANKNKVPIIPIDSEHAALKQCLSGINEDIDLVSQLILTASGGPFWNRPKETFCHITREEALRHPNWTMGSKITIDSATLMNKGLEVIEAHYLFNCPYDKLNVYIHPQSIVHSLVEFIDGNLLAQMGMPDMRFPIQYALSYPDKWPHKWPKMGLEQLQNLQFLEPENDKFPLLKAAFDAGRQGGTAPAVLNAANEACVQLFLEDKISFNDITSRVIETVASWTHMTDPTLEDIVATDKSVKEQMLYAKNY